ncbi:MAG TPA: NAD-binding protein [Actinomycetota bacterium]|nr:NAD-binding protein [Actinomycetota bacterium]
MAERPEKGWLGVRRLRSWLRAKTYRFFAISAGAVLLASAILFYFFETGRNPAMDDVSSGFVWVTRTLLEQGSPWEIATGPGLFLYYVVLVSGVGLAAMATGAFASSLLRMVLRKDLGMGKVRTSGHILICGWSAKGAEILRELHADEVVDKKPVVILAPQESSPTNDELVTFVRGNPSDAQDLLRAGLTSASVSIILADRSNPSRTPDEVDAKTLLTTLAVESICRECYTCVEVIRSENRQHFERTRADELIVSAELTGALLASAAETHGISRVVSDLITHPSGNEFYAIPLPADLTGKTFGRALAYMKERHDSLVVAVASSDGAHYEINPKESRELASEEMLLVISDRRPIDTPKRRPRRLDQSRLVRA